MHKLFQDCSLSCIYTTTMIYGNHKQERKFNMASTDTKIAKLRRSSDIFYSK